MSYLEDLEHSLNETADQDLGTVVNVLEGKELFDEASVVELCSLYYEPIENQGNWGRQEVRAFLITDPLFLHTVTPEIVELVQSILVSFVEGDEYSLFVKLIPRRVPDDWRQSRAEARRFDMGPNNQAGNRDPSMKLITEDRLRFDGMAELRMYRALKRAQSHMARHRTLGICPGVGFRCTDRTFWPDFIVTLGGRAAGIEVDGPTHSRRAAADQTRDRQLEDAGLTFVERLVVEDSTDDKAVDQFVANFIARLTVR